MKIQFKILANKMNLIVKIINITKIQFQALAKKMNWIVKIRQAMKRIAIKIIMRIMILTLVATLD